MQPRLLVNYRTCVPRKSTFRRVELIQLSSFIFQRFWKMILFDAYDLVNCGQYDTVMNPIGFCFFLWTMDDAQSA